MRLHRRGHTRSTARGAAGGSGAARRRWREVVYAGHGAKIWLGRGRSRQAALAEWGLRVLGLDADDGGGGLPITAISDPSGVRKVSRPAQPRERASERTPSPSEKHVERRVRYAVARGFAVLSVVPQRGSRATPFAHGLRLRPASRGACICWSPPPVPSLALYILLHHLRERKFLPQEQDPSPSLVAWALLTPPPPN